MSDLVVRLRRGFGGLVPPVNDEAANEIDRLRELNAELLGKVKLLFSFVYLTEDDERQIRALIGKAEGRE